MTDPTDRAPAETREGSAGARQDGPAGTRPDARPAGPLAPFWQLVALWEAWAVEAGTLAGLMEGAAQPTDVWYMRGQAAQREECAVQLRNLLGRLEDRRAAVERANGGGA